jgi:uncharacterized protein (TIRG00374 family)
MALSTANYWLIIPVFAILSASHVLRALRWKILMEPMGYNTSFPNTFFAVMIGYMANMAVPRLGEVLKCTILAKYEKVPAEKIVGTIVAERAFDVVSLGTIFILALIFQFDVVIAAYHHLQEFMAGKPHEVMSQTKKIVLIAIASIGIIFIVWLIISKKINRFFLAIKKILKGIWEGLSTASKLKHKKLFFVYSVSIWVLYLAGTWIGFYATKGTAGLGIEEAISCLAFASIGMIVTPGGIGAYAYLLAKVLELQDNSIPNSIGYANGTLQWFAQCIIVLVVGFVCLSLLPWYNKKKEDKIISELTNS